MDDLESRLGTLLGETPAGEPPEGLAGRVHRSVAARRRNRRTAWLAVAVSVTAVAVSAAVVVPLGVRGGGGQVATTVDVNPSTSPDQVQVVQPEPTATVTLEPTRTITATPRAGLGGSATESALRQLVKLTGVTTVKGRTTSGEPFVPAALGPDGRVIGTAWGGVVAEAPANGGTPRDLDLRADAGLGTDPGFRTWTEGEDQRCRTAAGETHTVSPQGVDPKQPVWVDGGVIVGVDVMRQPFVAIGCAGPGKMINKGEAVALSYPYLFVVEPANTQKLYQLDVRTGEAAKEYGLPEGVRRHTMSQKNQKWYAAASPKWFAWVADGVLRTTARDGWKQVSERRGLPKAGKGAKVRLTAGDRFVAYSTGTQSLIHDPVTGRTFKSPGLVLAKGDRLLWQEGRDFRVATYR